MQTCELCGKNIRFRRKKTARGYICRDCFDLIPSWVDISCAEKDELSLAKEFTEQRNKEFNFTASYQNLYIDGVHNMFALSCGKCPLSVKRTKHFKDIFYISELREVGIFCTNLRNIGKNSDCVVCDVKFRYKAEIKDFPKKIIEREIPLGSNVECLYDYQGNGKIDCREPAVITTFRALFNQMIDNEIDGIKEKLEFIQNAKSLIDENQKSIPRSFKSTDWARGVLFFQDNEPIDIQKLKKRRNEIIKIYHPDMGKSDDANAVSTLILEAYEILKSQIAH